MFIGVLIWFVKVTILEIAHVIVLRGIFGMQKPGEKSKRAGSQNQSGSNFSNTRSNSARPQGRPLPRDLEIALETLGLKTCREWDAIHQRYRQLAKMYHPDLNSEITQTGRRFMMYDAAYRKLCIGKKQYFT